MAEAAPPQSGLIDKKQSTGAEDLQGAIDVLTTHEENYTKVEDLVGARRFFRTPVYRLTVDHTSLGKTVKKKDMSATCPVCYSDYTRHGARQPKVLQCCYNVLCRHCILSWAEHCSFCRSEQGTAVDDLPTMDMRAAVLNELQKVERGNYADLRKAVEDWIIKVQRDACSTEADQTATEELKPTSVWISNTLSSDLGLPVESPPPDSAAAEILCLGEDLPPFVLTLLDNNKKRNDSSSNSEGLFGDARDFTVDMARKLLWSLHGYCHCDFVVLPCTLNLEEDRIHVAALTNEVNEQLRRSRLYYHGPKRLTAHTLSQIMKATEALAAMSYVPCFLKDLSTSEDWILLLDTDWRNVVSLIIEAIGDKGKTKSESEQTARVTFTADSMFKVKVAMLEAARRLSFTQRVTIVTAALDVKRCIEKLQSQSSTDYKMDLQLSYMFPDRDALLQLDGSACVIAFGCEAPRVRKNTGNTLEITEYQPKTETEEDDAMKLKDGDNTEKPEPNEKGGGTGQMAGSSQQPPTSPMSKAQPGVKPRETVSYSPVDVAENLWLQSVHDWYPNLHSQTYFLPPLYFKRVSYDVENVAGQPVLVPRTPGHVPVNPVPSGPPPQPNPPPLASRVWPDQPVPPGNLIPRVHEFDVRYDRAMQQVLQSIWQVAERRQEVMMVLSQLQFRKYLDNQVDPITAAATRLLPRPPTLGKPDGDFDVLIISRRYGLIVGEVKEVGYNPQLLTDQVIVKRVKKAVKQLKKADVILRQLVSDLAPVNVTRILMLPNITTQQLMTALSTDPQTEQDLCQCVEATDTAAAVARCLCADSSEWWERSVTDHGQDTNMTNDIYERLVARFCGPATSIEVPTVTTPRHSMELRTETDAFAHTGLIMAILTLYPEQVALLGRPMLQQVFLWGPPGTGKTVVLTLKGMQWRQRGKDIHLLSSHDASRAVIILIEQQLLHARGDGSTATPAAAPRVYRHMYDFNNKTDVETAVNELAAAANNGELYIIADEAFHGGHTFFEFVTHLSNRVPSLHLWAAAVDRVRVPPYVSVETLTRPLRSPPAVLREVEKSDDIDGSNVLRYSSRATPAPTDGPVARTLQHATYTPGGSGLTPLPGHTGPVPEHCEGCAEEIVNRLVELRVGQSGQDLQYRDTCILCRVPRDDLPVVRRLLARGLPVQVVTSRDDEAAIHDVALATRNAVTVTDCGVVTGLERRIVVVVGIGYGNTSADRLRQMSRSTSLLVNVGRPLEVGYVGELVIGSLTSFSITYG